MEPWKIRTYPRKLGLMFIEIVLNTEKYLVKPETAIVMHVTISGSYSKLFE